MHQCFGWTFDHTAKLFQKASCRMATLIDQIKDAKIGRRSKGDVIERPLMFEPSAGPIAATAIVALAPPFETFRTSRDFAACLGLTPLQSSTGGKQPLGASAWTAGYADTVRQRDRGSLACRYANYVLR
jgi:transposase